MRRFIGTAVVLFSCMQHYAMAEDVIPDSNRIKLMPYNEGDVYVITTKYGYQTNVVFGPSEEVQTISVGDRSLWQIIPAGHRLFIRPMEDGATTNMTIITNRHSYQFDLKAVSDDKNNSNIYVAQFVYKSDKPPAPMPMAMNEPMPTSSVMPSGGMNAPMPMVTAPMGNAAPMANPEPAASQEPVSAPPSSNVDMMPPSSPNYNYTFAGPDDLAPLKVYDDGRSTFFKYRDTTQPFPNVYIIDTSGKEKLTTPYRKDGYMVIDTVVGEFALKNSAGTIHVYNEMLNPPK